jgi:Fe-S-cluster containining protein
MWTEIGNRLDEIYEKIPKSRCDDGCSECCASVSFLGITKEDGSKVGELQRILRNLEGSGLENKGPDLERCPFEDQTKHRCTVYPLRPLVCRLWGVSEETACSRCVPERVLTTCEVDDVTEEVFSTIRDVVATFEK